MNSTIYIETSIIGYLTSRPSRDSITAANQRLTRDWWNQCRENFDIFIFQFVIDECAEGDEVAVKERLNVIADIQQLDVTEAVETLADGLIHQVPLPEKAQVDALHIAIATVHGIEYLLTWNYTHIANARLCPQIETICRLFSYEPPRICTPRELMEG